MAALVGRFAQPLCSLAVAVGLAASTGAFASGSKSAPGTQLAGTVAPGSKSAPGSDSAPSSQLAAMPPTLWSRPGACLTRSELPCPCVRW